MYNVYIGCKPKKIVMRTQIIQKMSSDKSKLTNLLKQNTLSCVVEMTDLFHYCVLCKEK